MMRTLALAKSERFRVTTKRPWTIEVTAIRRSFIGNASRLREEAPSNSAHFRPVSASQGRQWRQPTPASNQRSREVRFFP